jgi:hypothetical protein
MSPPNLDYYIDDPCVSVQSKGPGTFSFKPLFSTYPTFIYAMDDLNADEIKIEFEDRLSGGERAVQRLFHIIILARVLQ